MSSPILSSREFAAECGENATLASMFSRPRSRQLRRVGVLERRLRCRSSCRTRPAPGRPASFPSTTSALLAWTYRPRQLRLVDPNTTFFVFGPLTMIILLCCRLFMCWRFTLAAPAVFLRRFADCVSPESRFPVLLAVVDDDPQLLLQLFEPADDLRLAEIVGDDAHLGLFLDRLIEQRRGSSRAPRSPSRRAPRPSWDAWL